MNRVDLVGPFMVSPNRTQSVSGPVGLVSLRSEQPRSFAGLNCIHLPSDHSSHTHAFSNLRHFSCAVCVTGSPYYFTIIPSPMPHAVTQCKVSRGSARGAPGTLAKRHRQLFSIKRQGSRPVCQVTLNPSYQRGGEAFLLQKKRVLDLS